MKKKIELYSNNLAYSIVDCLTGELLASSALNEPHEYLLRAIGEDNPDKIVSVVAYNTGHNEPEWEFRHDRDRYLRKQGVISESKWLKRMRTTARCLITNGASEEGEIIHEDPCTILNGVVEYTVDSSMTTHRGDYMAVFNLEFTGGVKKTYKMPFVVLPRGIAKEGIGTHVSELTEDSTEDEVEDAINADLRNIRREGLGIIEGNMLILDIAQYKTGRRHRRW